MLYPLSLLWQGIHRLKQARDERDQYIAPVAVISIGNIVSGGGGKTPLTISIARRLVLEGYQVAVSHRGYRGEFENSLKVVHGSEIDKYSAAVLGDEAFMIAKAVPEIPVAVGKDRKLAIKTLLRLYPKLDLVILDDSLQNRRVRHDLDIITFSSETGIGNGFVLPAGYLREPLSSIRKDSLVVINDKNSDKEAVSELIRIIGKHTDKLFVGFAGFAGLIDHQGNVHEMDELHSKSVFLVSGIASPESFERTARGNGISWKRHFSYPDHYSYKVIDDLLALMKGDPAAWAICTEKDFAKLARHEEIRERILYLKLELNLDREEEFYRLLKERLAQKTH